MTATVADLYPEDAAIEVPPTSGPTLDQLATALAEARDLRDLLLQGSFPGGLSGKLVRAIARSQEMVRQVEFQLVKHPEYGRS